MKATEAKATDTAMKAAETRAMDAKATDSAVKASETKAMDAKATDTAVKTFEAKAVDAKATDTAVKPSETKAVDAKATDTATKAMEAKAMATRSGSFYNLDETGAGTAILTKSDTGKSILKFTGFKVTAGPDLVVYLVVTDPVAKAGVAVVGGGLNLGMLHSVNGDQSYAIPDGTDLSNYKSAIVWCNTYNVTFIAAPLKG